MWRIGEEKGRVGRGMDVGCSEMGSGLGCVQADLDVVRRAGLGLVNVTVGSALDIYGGDLPFQYVLAWDRGEVVTV